MEIRKTSIPYDVDRFWDGGCMGSDEWEDDYGTSVQLLTNGSGSAYICPEKAQGPWRLFVDHNAQGWRLSVWPGHPVEDYDLPWEASGKLGAVIACGIEQGTIGSEDIADLFTAPRMMVPTTFPTFADGVTIRNTFDWKVSFHDEGISMHNLRIRDYLFDFEGRSRQYVSVGTFPSAVRYREGTTCELCPDDWGIGMCCDDFSYARMMFGRKDYISYGMSWADHSARVGRMERSAAIVGNRLIKAAQTVTLEIEAYERACQGKEE